MEKNEEEQVVVICANPDTPSPWDDNIETQCFECGAKVIHRPHIPHQSIKVCIQCGTALLAKERGKVEVGVLQKSREEYDAIHGEGAMDRMVQAVRMKYEDDDWPRRLASAMIDHRSGR